MIFKNTLFALALLHGAASAERNQAARRPDVKRSLADENPGLSIDEFLKGFDDAKGPGERRKLQEEVIQTIDGEVTKDEVVAALTSLTKSADGQKAMFPDCLELFRYFDKNGNGVLDYNEIVAVFLYAGFGNPLSKKLATGLLLWYDKNPKDGVLNMKEIVAACKGGKKVVLS
jgi:Ca2+-binding EF-hand superfamily protein